MALQRLHNCNTIAAFRRLGLPPDCRTFEKEVEVLRDLELPKTIHHFSGNPKKREALEAAGFEVEREIEWCGPLGQAAAAEREMKRTNFAYAYRDKQ